ncbi:MAG: FG-GAP-like repeat-containing protein [Phycisphaerales bacterium]
MRYKQLPLAAIVVSVLAPSVLAQPAGPGPHAAPGATRCAAPPQGPARPFTEEAIARGVVYPVAYSSGFSIGLGGGAFVDLDADGDPDIVAIGREDGLVGLFENDGTGHFTNRSIGSGIPLLRVACAVCAADYDADGDMDIFINNTNTDDALLRNDGGFHFTDVTLAAGVGGGQGTGGGSTWGDFDGDGWLDLYVSNRTHTPILPSLTNYSTVRNRLYKNMGDGTFIDVAPALGVDEDAQTLVSAFLDYDLDGDADLYVGNDNSALCKQWTNTLYQNVGGTFVNVTAFSGTESCTDTMGIGIGDFDGNLFPDLYCTNTPLPLGNTLMLNNGDGTFDSVAEPTGTSSYALGWGCMFFDHDNDTHPAIFVCNRGWPNRLYDYSPTWPCPDRAAQMHLDDPDFTYNVSTADIDADGDLDLLVQDLSQNLHLYINHEGERRPWIRFHVVGEAPNNDAVGALLQIDTPGGSQISEVLIGGNNYRTQNELVQHFGLGAYCNTTQVHVRWPDSQERTLTNYEGGSVWTVFPPSMLGDSNGDGRIDAIDVHHLVVGLGPVRPGFESVDMNGDATIDLRDMVLLIDRMRERR